MARNLTFENSTPSSATVPALALRCDADRVIFENVRFYGYQDTLFPAAHDSEDEHPATR